MIQTRLPKLATFILGLFFGLALIAPLPFVVIMPGNAQDVLTKVITPSKKPSVTPTFYPGDGKIFLLSILITNPSAYVTGFELIYSWLRSDYAVMPRSLYYKDGRSAAAEKKIAKTEMVDSQISAKVAALNYLKKNYPQLGTAEIAPSDIDISLAKTGGPSGGLAFALGIVELLTPENILKGRIVATTGTIDNKGRVGSIGGIDQKLFAAREAGATIAVIPRANCQDITFAGNDLQIIAVNNLSEAFHGLIDQKIAQNLKCPA